MIKIRQRQSSCQGIVRTELIAIFVFLSCWRHATAAETIAPAPGTIFVSPNDVNKRHIGPTGKPCLSLAGSAKPQIVNREIFDHMVSIANSCPQRINVHVCYYGTQHCVTEDVAPYERKETVLGVFPKLQYFRFEYKEKF
jgi:hypothetical protein